VIKARELFQSKSSKPLTSKSNTGCEGWYMITFYGSRKLNLQFCKTYLFIYDLLCSLAWD